MSQQPDPRSDYVASQNRLAELDQQTQVWAARRDAADEELLKLRNERAQLHAQSEALWNARPAGQDPEPTPVDSDEAKPARRAPRAKAENNDETSDQH